MKNQYITINIDQLEPNGKGTGPFTDQAGNSKRAEVPFCMPGDRIETVVKRKKRGVFSGPLLQVVQPAPERIAPRCIHFASCGGCSSQEIPYAQQLKFKEQITLSYFQDKLNSKTEIRPIIPCEDPWNYRNKMEFTFSQDKQGKHYLGLFLESGRGKVFNLEQCHLVSPWFAEVVKRVRAWWETSPLLAYYPPFDRGTMRTLILREGLTSGDRMAMLTVSGNPDFAIHQQEIDQWKALFTQQESLFLRIHQAIKGKPTQFFEMHLQGPEYIREQLTIQLDNHDSSTLHFQVSPSAFFQPNTWQAEKLYSAALNLAKLSKNDVVYDLFCGTGTLGLVAARFVKQVIGIEISPEAALDARTNAKMNGIENIEIVTGAVAEILSSKKYPAPQLILLDPPRSGLGEAALEQVIALNSPTLVYISCNPETQARDLQTFLAAGYTLQVIQPVDQFPHTPHIENIILLTLAR